MSKPKKNPVKFFRICVMGPSYVGKTQVINRFINNSFTGYYEPTHQEQQYRRAYNLFEDQPEMEPQFIDLDVIDMFPHDHPLLDIDKNMMNETAKKMSNRLDEYLQSPFKAEYRVPEHLDNQGNIVEEKRPQIEIIDRIHAYVFVFDSSNKKTFENMMCVVETILELQKSKMRSAPKDKPPFLPKMLCLGNKWDLRENKSKGELKKKDI
jgi:hypothetical protein